MRIVKPEAYVIYTGGGDILKHIENCGRVCYKSESRITADSAPKFIANIIGRGHEAVLEHGSIILAMDSTEDAFWELILFDRDIQLDSHGEYVSYLRFTDTTRGIVSGNIRAWREFIRCALKYYKGLPRCISIITSAYPALFPEYQVGMESLFNYGTATHVEIFDPSQLVGAEEMAVHGDISVRFICDRGVSHEIVRHRLASYCQESTRYCNYSKGAFGKMVTFIAPSYLVQNTDGYTKWAAACQAAEDAYFELLDWGCSPQEARSVLPNSLKTEVIMSANIREWRHFLKLRCSPAAHPQMREVATQLLTNLMSICPTMFCDIAEEVHNNV